MGRAGCSKPLKNCNSPCLQWRWRLGFWCHIYFYQVGYVMLSHCVSWMLQALSAHVPHTQTWMHGCAWTNTGSYMDRSPSPFHWACAPTTHAFCLGWIWHVPNICIQIWLDYVKLCLTDGFDMFPQQMYSGRYVNYAVNMSTTLNFRDFFLLFFSVIN